MSFRLKTILGIALIEAILLTILVVSGLNYLSSSNEQQLLKRAQSTAKLVSTMTADSVVSVDLATLDALVEQVLKNRDILYLRIRNADGQTLSEGGQADSLKAAFKEDLSVDETLSDQRLDVSSQIKIEDNVFGHIELGLSTAKLQKTYNDAFNWMVIIALTEMFLVAIMGLLLGTYLTQQLHKLRVGAKRVASGDFGHNIPVKGKDELADTALSFNKMSDALRDYAAIAEEARLKAEAGREFAESTLKDALDSLRDGVLILDSDQDIVLMNHTYQNTYQLNRDQHNTIEKIIEHQSLFFEDEKNSFVDTREEQLANYSDYPRWEARLKDGRYLLIAQHPMSQGGLVITETDVSELYEALEENRQLQFELMQKHKTEALGTLAGGMAHEINTPVQIISDNMTFLADSVGYIFEIIEGFKETTEKRLIEDKLEEIDWEFIKEEVPGALDEMQKGTERVRDLISTFKQFTAPSSGENELTDLGTLIQSIVDVHKSEWGSDANIIINVSDGMPLVPCKAAQINQALQGLISNAVHAIQDGSEEQQGEVNIRIHSDDDFACIEIEDNGCGISDENKDKIFDALFTTKEPGRGTGNGLALCQTIISRNHNGRILFDSQLGKGTQFKIFLPLNQEEKTSVLAQAS